MKDPATIGAAADESGKYEEQDGSGGRYCWSQTDEEVEIRVPVGEGCLKQHVSVQFSSKRVLVRVDEGSGGPAGTLWTVHREVRWISTVVRGFCEATGRNEIWS